jgi:hypothetical protein
VIGGDVVEEEEVAQLGRTRCALAVGEGAAFGGQVAQGGAVVGASEARVEAGAE